MNSAIGSIKIHKTKVRSYKIPPTLPIKARILNLNLHALN